MQLFVKNLTIILFLRALSILLLLPTFGIRNLHFFKQILLYDQDQVGF